MGWVEDALGYRSVMEPPRSDTQDGFRGLLSSGLRTVAGIGDAASLAIPGRPIGASLLSERLDRFMGDPNAPGAPAAYSAGSLLGDVAQMLAPTGLLGRGAPAATKAVPASLARQAGAVGDLEALLAARQKAARRNATIPETKGGLGLGSRNTADQRAAAQDYETGWWRGGPRPQITPTGTTPATGNWYTRDPSQATDYARGADVREYALRGPLLDAMAPADPTKLRALADVLDAEGLAPGISKELRAITAAEQHSGRGIYSGLAASVGEQKAGELMQKIGYRGIRNLNNEGDAMVFSPGVVRDANRAAFDPTKLGRNDILAGALPFSLGTGLLGGWLMQEPK